MICPIRSNQYCSCDFTCKQEECAWWCPDDKCCAVKKIAIELIKIGEKDGR